MLNVNDIGIVDRYLKGELIGEELTSFERRLEEDNSFRDEVISLRRVKSGVRLSKLEEKLGEMEEWESEVLGSMNDGTLPNDTEGIRKSKKVIPINWRWVTGIAASILIVGAVFWNNARDERLKGQRIIDEYFVHIPSGFSVKRQAVDYNERSSLFIEAYSLYELKEYSLAAPLLEKIYLIEQDTMSLFFAAVARLGNGQLDESQKIISKDFGEADTLVKVSKFKALIKDINVKLKYK